MKRKKKMNDNDDEFYCSKYIIRLYMMKKDVTLPLRKYYS